LDEVKWILNEISIYFAGTIFYKIFDTILI